MKVFSIIILLLFILDTHGQFISGRVTYTDGKPAIGASVWIKEKGGVVGAVTDINGNYHFEIDTTCLTLCVSYIDCFPESLEINNRNVINFILRERPVELINIEVIALIDKDFENLRIDKIVRDSTHLLFKYFCDNIDYPIKAIKSEIQGKVLVKFKIDSTDLSCNVNIVRGIDSLIDNNVKETIQSYPDWKSLILTDEMIEKAISPDIYGFSFWLRTEKEYILPVIFTIKEMNDR